jgi:hypothetical protein
MEKDIGVVKIGGWKGKNENQGLKNMNKGRMP